MNTIWTIYLKKNLRRPHNCKSLIGNTEWLTKRTMTKSNSNFSMRLLKVKNLKKKSRRGSHSLMQKTSLEKMTMIWTSNESLEGLVGCQRKGMKKIQFRKPITNRSSENLRWGILEIPIYERPRFSRKTPLITSSNWAKVLMVKYTWSKRKIPKTYSLWKSWTKTEYNRMER